MICDPVEEPIFPKFGIDLNSLAWRQKGHLGRRPDARVRRWIL